MNQEEIINTVGITKESGFFRWVKFIFGFLFSLFGGLSFLFSCFADFSLRNLIDFGSLMQISAFVTSAGFYLIIMRNKRGLPGIKRIIIVLAIIFFCIFVYTNFIPGVARRISGFPDNVNFIPNEQSYSNQSYTYNNHQLIWRYDDFNRDSSSASRGNTLLGFKDLSTGDVYNVVGIPRSAALGDDFAVWVIGAQNPPAKKDSNGSAQEFDVRLYDFKTKTETVILKRFDNDLNANRANIAVSGRWVALSTFSNKLIFVNVDTKQVEKVPMIAGYSIRGYSLVAFSKDKAVFTSAGKIFVYNMTDKTFNIIYSPSSFSRYGVSEIRPTEDGRLYWSERKEWARYKYYTLKF